MWQDGNHIEMGLHVFFGCYENLFGVMRKLGIIDSLLLKEHTHAQAVVDLGCLLGKAFGPPWQDQFRRPILH